MNINSGWLTVNRTCNMRCSWCYQMSSKFEADKVMPLKLGLELIDLMVTLKIKGIVFIGGEPTVNHNLLPLISYAKASGLRTGLVTNGLRLADKSYCEDLKANGLDAVTISLKGTSEEEYEAQTGTKGYAKVSQAATNLKGLGITSCLEFIIVETTIPRLEEVCATVAKIVMDNSMNSLAIDLGAPIMSKNGVTASGIPNPAVLGEAVNQTHRLLATTGVNYFFILGIPFCLIDPVVLSELKSSGRISRQCQAVNGSGLIVDEKGCVLPCNPFADFPLIQYGRDFQTSDEFTRLWNSPSLTKFRQMAGRYPSGKCQSCEEWSSCGGGCFIRWLYFDPKEYILSQHSYNRQ